MKTIVVTHEVDDVDHWLASPKRREVFGPLGITVRVFTSPDNPSRVGLVVETPSLEVFQEAMATPEAAEAMKFDGVRPETLQLYFEG